MKFQFAIAVVAVAVLGLQQYAVAAKSSALDSSSQSLLDPLTIQGDARQSKRKAKHNQSSSAWDRDNSSSNSSRHSRSKLSDAYNLPSTGALSSFSHGMQVTKHPDKEQKKAQKIAGGKKSSLAWGGKASNSTTGSSKRSKKSRSNNQRIASADGNKNVFENAADKTGKAITAPARKFKALFNRPKQSQQQEEN